MSSFPALVRNPRENHGVRFARNIFLTAVFILASVTLCSFGFGVAPGYRTMSLAVPIVGAVIASVSIVPWIVNAKHVMDVTWRGILAVGLGLLAALLCRVAFLESHVLANDSTCRSRMLIIEAAKEIAASDPQAAIEGEVDRQKMATLLSGGQIPSCPDGYEYVLGARGDSVRCPMHGRAVTDRRQPTRDSTAGKVLDVKEK